MKITQVGDEIDEKEAIEAGEAGDQFPQKMQSDIRQNGDIAERRKRLRLVQNNNKRKQKKKNNNNISKLSSKWFNYVIIPHTPPPTHKTTPNKSREFHRARWQQQHNVRARQKVFISKKA